MVDTATPVERDEPMVLGVGRRQVVGDGLARWLGSRVTTRVRDAFRPYRWSPRETLEIDGDDDRRTIVFGLVDGYARPVLALSPRRSSSPHALLYGLMRSSSRSRRGWARL